MDEQGQPALINIYRLPDPWHREWNGRRCQCCEDGDAVAVFDLVKQSWARGDVGCREPYGLALCEPCMKLFITALFHVVVELDEERKGTGALARGNA